MQVLLFRSDTTNFALKNSFARHIVLLTDGKNDITTSGLYRLTYFAALNTRVFLFHSSGTN